MDELIYFIRTISTLFLIILFGLGISILYMLPPILIGLFIFFMMYSYTHWMR